jgi:hypothetical protein
VSRKFRSKVFEGLDIHVDSLLVRPRAMFDVILSP